ncbi:hypothetical protein HOY80DRAFT_941276 [Tuber brumale]|nr:hypothetical protein HOY80DRAFT_941276 [Tuber brumale]
MKTRLDCERQTGIATTTHFVACYAFFHICIFHFFLTFPSLCISTISPFIPLACFSAIAFSCNLLAFSRLCSLTILACLFLPSASSKPS